MVLCCLMRRFLIQVCVRGLACLVNVKAPDSGGHVKAFFQPLFRPVMLSQRPGKVIVLFLPTCEVAVSAVLCDCPFWAAMESRKVPGG